MGVGGGTSHQIMCLGRAPLCLLAGCDVSWGLRAGTKVRRRPPPLTHPTPAPRLINFNVNDPPRGPVLEVIVSRMRYVASEAGRGVRFVGLSTALANAQVGGERARAFEFESVRKQGGGEHLCYHGPRAYTQR